MRRLLLVTFTLLTTIAAGQGTYTTKSKKAIKLYQESENYFVRKQYNPAMQLLNEALEKDEQFAEAHYRKGLIYYDRGRYEEALTSFLSSMKNASKRMTPNLNFLIGEIYLREGDYQSSQSYLEKFLEFPRMDPAKVALAQNYLVDCKYALSHPEERMDFDPKPLPETVNAYALQYFPVLTADNASLIFTKRDGYGIQHDEDIFVSHREGNNWSKPENLSNNINSSFNEGTCTISADGRMLIFTSCERNTFGTCDLFASYKTGEEWSFPENLGPEINSPAWESQPTLSADGRTLYFISSRRGGVGRRDIWYSVKDEFDRWTPAQNLGKEVNTIWDEVSPFIHVNGQTLFFGSTGYPGYGGFDLYSSEKLDSGWTKPVNLGRPLNTHHDEVSLFITSDGSEGYYSYEQRRPDGSQVSELYQFEVEKIGITNLSNYVFGRVFDAETGDPIGALIELHDINRGNLISKVNADPVNGKYLIVLTEGAEYALHVSKRGYLFKSLSFNYQSEEQLEPIELDVYLEKPAKGRKVVLNNIYFDFDSYSIRDKSKTELNQIISFLRQNADVKIEIGGHTDDRGSEEYNQRLSENRAKAVYDYLIAQDVSTSRLEFRGYGKSDPVASNDSEENRQLNRRIEFKVL